MKNCTDKNFENCIDEGMIQAFLDGELANDASETIATHVGDCDACAMLLADTEEENSIAFAALDNEFNIPVPTYRLWSKINDEIEKARPTFWQQIVAFFSFKNASMLAFASLLVVFGMFATALIYKQSIEIPNTNVADKFEPKQAQPINELPTQTPEIVKDTPPQIEKTRMDAQKTFANFKVEKAKFVNETPRLTVEKSKVFVKSPKQRIEQTAPIIENRKSQLINGEDTYIKTIATLSKNVDAKKDQILRPSARVGYERDIALVEQAIKTMQTKARKNPKDEGAKQVLFASYQNKIDLLNSVTEKGEMIASLK
jgi:hypothetical protein